ncbi:MAG: hypothetical protein C0518_03040 [Opitutus sp.]|nr:hypothetical protein [Opitutus sp.]
MNESETAHPWSRHYAARGEVRPEFTPVPGVEPSAPTEPVAEDARLIGALPGPPAVPMTELARAVERTEKIDWHATPHIELFTAEDLERVRRETEARRWMEVLGTLRLVAYGFAAAVLLVLGFELAQRLGNRLPSDQVLAAQGEKLGEYFLPRHATETQPLVVGGSEARLLAHPAAARATYEFVLTLQLREPLYAPADSNGAQAYRDLQRAVAEAHARFVGARLYADFPALANPVEMPVLLALTHRTGERLTVHVPVTATRRIFGWKLEPDLASARVESPRFTGEVLARQPAAHLIFNRPESREVLRNLQVAARAYVLDVQRALATRRREADGR